MPSIEIGADAPLLLARLESHPAARVAVENDDDVVTYGELCRSAQALAGRMRELLQRSGGVVAIDLPRGAAAITALVAAVDAGAAFLPIDPQWPDRRRELALGLCDLVLTRSDTGELQLLPRTGSTTDFEPAIDGIADVACVLFTSGSTGTPKGVPIRRLALERYCQCVVELYELGDGDRVSQLSGLSSDFSLEEIFPSLYAGVTIVVDGLGAAGSAAGILERWRQQAVTFASVPTAVWRELCAYLSRDPRGLRLPALRLLVIGGEAADPASARIWLRAFGGSSALLNTYGPTEATVIATVAAITESSLKANYVPLGAPLPGIELEIRDPDGGTIRGAGEGELVIRGWSVAGRYIGGDHFQDDRFEAPDGERPNTYRTGDNVKRHADGELEFLGRLDRMVKLRGFRVGLDDVEHSLKAIAGVKEAAVVIEAKDQPTERLTAHVVAGSQSEAAIRRAAAEQGLPAYMVPRRIVLHRELPRLQNGNLDRQALVGTEPQRSPPPPGLPTTEVITAAWRAVLGLDSIDEDSDFFEIGGDSVAMLRVVTLLNDWGFELQLDDAFDHRTPAAGAEHLVARLAAPGGVTARPDSSDSPKV
jgi:nonribosomal peptide synthetase MxcG